MAEGDRAKGFIGTGSIGAGVNNPNVCFVGMIGPQYGMTDVAQKAGRAGRGAHTGTVLMMVDDVSLELLKKQTEKSTRIDHKRYEEDSEAERLDKLAAYKMYTSNECIRMHLALYFDGQTGAQCLAASRPTVLCSVCKRAAIAEGLEEESGSMSEAQGMDISGVTHRNSSGVGMESSGLYGASDDFQPELEPRARPSYEVRPVISSTPISPVMSWEHALE